MSAANQFTNPTMVGISFFNYRWIRFTFRWLLGLVFLYAGINKLSSPQNFADSIASFQLLPISLINPSALGLPLFEISIGAFLIIGWCQRLVMLAAVGMTGVFAVAMITALARGLDVDCGCFGVGTPSLFKTWTSLGRDFLLAAAATFLYVRIVREESLAI